MTQFAGLCVGGPLAGQQAVNKTQTLHVEERPELPPLSAGPQPIPTDLVVTRHIYNWHQATGRIAFWIVEGKTIDDALEELAVVYMKARPQ